ncbi:MAG TPA: DsbC family protein [Verrucomicrobiae bacterium]|nr:DsbC family protein [Verrucomicrobiae bacterium]
MSANLLKKLLLVVAFCCFPLVAFAFGTGAQGCAGDCTACHKLTREEATEIFRRLDPGLSVSDISLAPAGGLFQVVVKREGQTMLLYLDFSKKYLFSGKLFEIATRSDLTQKTIEESTTVDIAKIPLKDALVMGNPKGSKVLYVFSDPECPFCGKLHKDLEQMVKEDPQLKVNVILVPLDIHPNAAWKSNSIVCTSKKSMSEALSMLEKSFEGGTVKKVDCAGDYAAEIKKKAQELQISMTPMTVFPDGKVVFGAKGTGELKKGLEQHQKR